VRILGFDFGMKKIGVAAGQTVTKTASPLCQLKAQDGVPNWHEMDALFAEWEPKIVIIGLPLHADGSESELVPRAKSFGKKLQKRYPGIECHFVNEHLTSFEARQIASSNIDATAAMLIIKTWLASN
jgi:putative Holliday junction resolvase